MTQTFTSQELLGIGFKLIHMPWITVQNYLQADSTLMSANLIEQLVHDSNDHLRVKSILAAWGPEKLSIGETGPWMTREEWLERMHKSNLKTTSRYHDAYESKIFRKYQKIGIFEVKGTKFRLVIGEPTLTTLKNFQNINYFLNR